LGVPKRKVSKSKRDKRRTHWKAEPPNIVVCSNCGQPKLSHRICPNCGYYKGRSVIVTET